MYRAATYCICKPYRGRYFTSSCARRQEPPSCAGVRVGVAVWAADQPERTGCQRRLALRARRRWRGRCAPGRLRQPSHFLAPRARRRRTPRARAPTCAPPVAHVLLGMVGIDDVVHCALLESSGGRDLSFSRGRGRGGTPRGPQCRLCHTPAERQHYGSWHEGGASSVAAAPRSRVTGAPKLCQPRIAYGSKRTV